MPDFTQRSARTELMDEGGLSFAEFHHCLQSLEVINVLTLAYPPTLRWLKTMMKAGAPLTILDAGSGGGDMLRRAARLARRQKCPVDLIGVDLNPWSAQSAALSSPGSAIRYETGDIFAFSSEQPVDIILCSLFTHHLSDGQIVDFLRWMDARADKGWFINDLHRHWLPYYFIKAATAVFSRNRMIRHDAAVSVARAFTLADWHRLLDAAGLQNQARVRWVFPFRICVSCRKP
jgi:2-polyprenyl-3-methyl-5-hydroxy-6-metoxy-1,4-benzoquinol methylase